jgi:Fur family peroxide stress response transcriptional regulator
MNHKYTKVEIDERTEAMADRCRESGMKLTQQRITLFRELLRFGEHISAEALHERVHKSFPAMSLSTVYNTLEALSGIGVIGTVDGLDGPRLYDPEPAPHHHLVCRDTGAVIDLDEADGGAIIDRAALSARGIEVEDVRLIVYGRMRAAM